MKKQSNHNSLILINEEIYSAIVEFNSLKNMLNRALRLVENSPNKEPIYAAAADIVTILPEKIDKLEKKLSIAGYLLSSLYKKRVRHSLSIGERAKVDEVLNGKSSVKRKASISRVAHLYMEKVRGNSQ